MFDEGRVTFAPTDRDPDDQIQYVLIDAVEQGQNTWEGTYYAPRHQGTTNPMDLAITWEPQEAWFAFRDPDPIGQQMWCEEVPDDMPGVDQDGSTPTTQDDKGPPAAQTDTATLRWHISAQPNPDPVQNSCQIRVTWETEDGQELEDAGSLLLDFQPQTLCDAFQDQSGTFEATAIYPWEVVNRLEYTGCHITNQETEVLEDLTLNGTAKYWPINPSEIVLEPGQCRSRFEKEMMFRFRPEKWPSQPPQDTPFPTSPEEGNIAIQYDCQWHEYEIVAHPTILVFTTHWFCTNRCSTIYVEGEGRQTPYGGGYTCDKTITHITWECGDACVYLEQPGEFVLPVPILERVLTLHP
jgi:hypothetical protein